MGMRTEAMLQAWEEFKREPRRYNMVEHNCSTVIAGLLELGSGIKPSFDSAIPIDDHVTNWAQRLFLRIRFMSGSIRMWTPDAVLRFADDIAAKVRHR